MKSIGFGLSNFFFQPVKENAIQLHGCKLLTKKNLIHNVVRDFVWNLLYFEKQRSCLILQKKLCKLYDWTVTILEQAFLTVFRCLSQWGCYELRLGVTHSFWLSWLSASYSLPIHQYPSAFPPSCICVLSFTKLKQFPHCFGAHQGSKPPLFSELLVPVCCNYAIITIWNLLAVQLQWTLVYLIRSTCF